MILGEFCTVEYGHLFQKLSYVEVVHFGDEGSITACMIDGVITMLKESHARCSAEIDAPPGLAGGSGNYGPLAPRYENI